MKDFQPIRVQVILMSTMQGLTEVDISLSTKLHYAYAYDRPSSPYKLLMLMRASKVRTGLNVKIFGRFKFCQTIWALK